MYLYPNNLKAKPTLWLWKMTDIIIIGISFLLSVFIYTRFNIMLLLVLSTVYTLLTIQMDDLSIIDFIIYASRFFIFSQQTYFYN